MNVLLCVSVFVLGAYGAAKGSNSTASAQGCTTASEYKKRGSVVNQEMCSGGIWRDVGNPSLKNRDKKTETSYAHTAGGSWGRSHKR